MQFDYGSVLLAVGAAGVALCFTLITNWLRQRSSGFLMSWGLSMAVIVASVTAFSAFNATGNIMLAMLACFLLTTGFAISYGGMAQFRDGRFPVRDVLTMVIVAGAPVSAAFAIGYDGMGYWLVNLAAAALVMLCGLNFWRIRAESPGPIGTIAGLHFMMAATFVLCTIVGFIESPLYLLRGTPENWAEVLNLVCSVIAITGIGGLFVTIHQERISRRHETNARTDPLTGLFNRRALFERFEDGIVPAQTALIVFDLDEFKGHNDRYGHGFGDTVLANFAELLRSSLSIGSMAVRLGGEEFSLVMPNTTSVEALAVAENIRTAMANSRHFAGGQAVVCTVSAGVAFAGSAGKSLDTLLRKADIALYRSKDSGRNTVTPVASNAA